MAEQELNVRNEVLWWVEYVAKILVIRCEMMI